ncbi:CIS tube protein [Streptomyces vinaceus]|uniref:CIS tube protein n=1 Tax=Streptomyces vinaceus TaxID=1960 RepID=UPI003673D395
MTTLGNAYGPAVLTCTQAPMIGTVPFQLNPDSISISRDVRAVSLGSKKGGSLGTVFKRADPSKISLSDVTIRGMETKPLCDQLLNWMSPGGGRLGQMVGGMLTVRSGGKHEYTNRLPTLTFMWGPPGMGFFYSVMLMSATIKYVRFNAAAVPVRAKVSLQLTEQPNLLGTLPTNPTSGGLPGRGTRTLTEGENLQAVALDDYGSPHAWRDVARANGIEDPLRVRPGQVLYLPHPEELATEEDR